MFTKDAEMGLRGVMEYSEMQDLRDIVCGITGMTSRTTSKMPRRELVTTVIRNAKSAGQILRYRCLVKPAIAFYLKEIGISISQTHKKEELIQICLERWGVKESSPEEDIEKEINRLQKKLRKDIKQREKDYEESVKRMKEELDKDLEEMNREYEEDLTHLKRRFKKIKREPDLPHFIEINLLPSSSHW